MDTSREVPFKDISGGQTYSADEIAFLKTRWSDGDRSAIARWLASGAQFKDRPPQLLRTFHTDRNPRTYDLRGIDVTRVKLVGSEPPRMSSRIDLAGARLEFANLSGVNLRRADLKHAHLEHAALVRALLEYADLRWASLHGASLVNAVLSHVRLAEAELVGADLNYARLDRADLTGANLLRANLSNVFVDDTVFLNVTWRPKGRSRPDPDLYRNLDLRGVWYSDPLFDQFVRQSEFIRRCRQTWPGPVYWLWKLTCDCGRSLQRWLLTCGTVIALFWALFSWADAVGSPLVEIAGHRPSWLTHLYVSVGMFLTLGWASTAPVGWAGELAMIVEAAVGYVLLAGLISIFATKMLPPR